VEDEEPVRKIASRTLARAGYEVLEAASAKEAEKAVLQNGAAVNLLITDLVMPGDDGIALAKKLKEKFPEMKLLFMSGYTDRAVYRQELF
jgi:DNA-binding NtrC family response regulator